MKTKLFEVRDSATFIPVIAIKLGSDDEAERYLLAESGYGVTAEDQSCYVLVSRLNGGRNALTYNPLDWDSNTMCQAHEHICEMFDQLESGSVIDVEYLRGVSTRPKISQRFGYE